ncbi:MAG: DUF1080 domain-containing protein [Planctomycetes bacterium]|nr:DUF1080 domain-containing protein [Planctomycetota bacterium]
MRPIVACCLLLAISLPCHAQPKPNTLTPKEIADGWILLFDGETTFGWSDSAKEKITIADGALIIAEDANIRSTTLFWNCELALEYRGQPLLTLQDSGRKKDGVGVSLKKSDEWRSVSLRASDGKISDSTGQITRWEGSSLIIGVDALHGKIALRNIKLRPLNTKSLFNGKDLDGWKEFPNKKSKFAVVDNAINVKDGPGDLQTVGKYKDFVLQLDCISHGKHLNSGIFFRCRDNEYQNGYEAQIHNGFDEKPKKYQIEEYDPKSNKLLGKKEMDFNATDFGTGAIYRRMPARKQMAKDGEWFAMTVVAHGNHLATWVNGVQVTDWTDNRPKSDNARTGCKLDAGHISIQGHDPTTNLSFKNFRIAELK